jgi:hydrophobe/amphiphile efflux-1 (HAE1) family protein
MNFARFFITRPIFAAVLSLAITLVGALALFRLPVEQYPDVVPPTVVVMANYPGANPRTIAETVATPLEQEINGVEGLLYLSSTATSDGVLQITVTFKLGTDLNRAQQQVQNRVSIALPLLPEEVRRLGVKTIKQSPNLTMVVHLLSTNTAYNELFVGNYAFLNVKDTLQRLPGVGSVQVFGARDYAMRLWLDPDKLAARNLAPGDVVDAVREQNVQVAAGVIGAQPAPSGTPFQLTVQTQGRLLDEEQFGNIIVKTDADGRVVRLRDVARTELAARDYNLDSFLNGVPAAALVIFQLPGSNALETRESVGQTMEELKKKFPPGLTYSIVYDTTIFARQSIDAVVHTLFEAILLVVIVVIVFLQTWRASVIPLLAVPVSLVGTFAVMAVMGFSLNNLTLFGLVLAIGIVVDDAIVVVENVERNIQLGLAPLAATQKAMQEVSGPVIAVAVVLCAVFVPTAFLSGITGQFYRQFALTIAVSTVISAFNSLTLSPALSAILLKPHGAKPDWFQRLLNLLFGWFFRWFNRAFETAGKWYGGMVRRLIRLSAVAVIVYVGLLALTYLGFRKVPEGFVPLQDQAYFVIFAQLPDGASLERTREVILRAGRLAREVPGITDSVEFPGFSLVANGNAANQGTIFLGVQDFKDRRAPEKQMKALIGQLYAKMAEIQEANVFVFPPPPLMGLGNVGGFRLQIKDTQNQGTEALFGAALKMMIAGNQVPGLANVFTTMQPNVPQLFVDVDREKAKTMNVPLRNIFETLQIYLGSLYVNDFNRFGRIYQVIAQAENRYRLRPDDILRLKIRNASGEMVPIGTLATVKESTGLDIANRYNLSPSADLNGATLPGVSSGYAIQQIEALARRELPPGFEIEWTELTLQQIVAGNSALFIFPVCVVLAFLALAAQYESWTLPLAILLIVPMCVLSAVAGILARAFDNNIFTQIGLVVLVGLSAKNAILIVEFAKELHEQGRSPADAAIEACRLRLRPILMTSFAFILGVLPLVVAEGAGAEMRQALGTAVFSGMLGVTFFGLLLTPVFYVLIVRLTERFGRKPQRHAEPVEPASAPVAHPAA